jgi:hypothetical protein
MWSFKSGYQIRGKKNQAPYGSHGHEYVLAAPLHPVHSEFLRELRA